MGIDHDRFRERLLAEREALSATADTARGAAGTVELDQTRVGRLSRMDALQSQAMSMENNRRRAQRLALIEAALARLDAGEFGACAECGEPIAEGRLAHDPAALLCIACAEERER